MADIINGMFETFGLFFILLSIIRLHREGRVAGVSYYHAGFFTLWGFWNLYFYPSLGQWLSFLGGLGIAIANTVWLSQLIYYSWYPRQ